MKNWNEAIEYAKKNIGQEQAEILNNLKKIGFELLQSIAIFNEKKLEIIIQGGSLAKIVIDKNTKIENGLLKIDLFERQTRNEE